MKDTFNLKEYLIENKMTEASRGKTRKHFTNVSLNKSVILESGIPIDEEAFTKNMLRQEYLEYEDKYGKEKAVKIFQKFHPEVDVEEFVSDSEVSESWGADHPEDDYMDWTDRESMRADDYLDRRRDSNLDEAGKSNWDWKEVAKLVYNDLRKTLAVTERPSLKDLEEIAFWYWDDGESKESTIEALKQVRNVESHSSNLDEVGYTDDDDDSYYDDDFLGAHGSNADLGIASDRRAEKAAKRGMKGTDLDVDAADDGELEDNPEGSDEFEDPEDISADSQPEATEGAVDMAKVFGKNAPYVEVLVDDLGTYLKGPRGNWRVNVSTAILKRAVESARQYLEDYEYPKKGVLYLSPNKMGQYDTEVRDNGKAVVAVHRDALKD